MNDSRATKEKHWSGSTVRVFMLTFLATAVVLSLFLHIFYTLGKKDLMLHIREDEQNLLDIQETIIVTYFGSILSDLMILVQHNELFDYLETGNEKNRAAVEEEYLGFLLEKVIYDQVRFIGADGMEIMRCNYAGGSPLALEEHLLQQKEDRYYFRETMQMGPREVFISPLDLNMENGQIEQPYKPVIRFSTPVFDRRGGKRGIVVINYLAERILEHLESQSWLTLGNFMLLNDKGYFLSSYQPEDEWGFLIGDRSDRTMAALHPEAWRIISSSMSGQFVTDKGMYTFQTVYPMMESFERSRIVSANTDYYWKLVSFIPDGIIRVTIRRFITKIAAVSSILFIFGLAVSWIIAQAFTKRRLYHRKLIELAHYDSLTGLENRAFFTDNLRQRLHEADRYDRKTALLYIDLDDFKTINDTFGHKAGDTVLSVVANRIQSSIRKSDIAARLGGDEFVVLLLNLQEYGDAGLLAEKIISSITEPVEFTSGTGSVGASVGIGLFPKDGYTADTLISVADKAMYEAKRGGKNSFVYHSDPTPTT